MQKYSATKIANSIYRKLAQSRFTFTYWTCTPIFCKRNVLHIIGVINANIYLSARFINFWCYLSSSRRQDQLIFVKNLEHCLLIDRLLNQKNYTWRSRKLAFKKLFLVNRKILRQMQNANTNTCFFGTSSALF